MNKEILRKCLNNWIKIKVVLVKYKMKIKSKRENSYKNQKIMRSKKKLKVMNNTK